MRSIDLAAVAHSMASPLDSGAASPAPQADASCSHVKADKKLKPRRMTGSQLRSLGRD